MEEQGTGAGGSGAARVGAAARELAGEAVDAARDVAAERLDRVAKALGELVESLEKRGARLESEALRAGARAADAVVERLRDGSGRETVERAFGRASEHPALLAAGMFAIGFLAVRVARS